jgi:hypothetical protein
MFRSTFIFALTLTTTSMAYGQAGLDDFQFPTFADSPSDKSAPKSLIVEQAPINTDDEPQASTTKAKPQRSRLTAQHDAEITTDPIEVVAKPYNAFANTQAMPAAFSGYMPMASSSPSPLLRQMQCSSNACPDVWAGFAAQHAADNARFCNGHGCGAGCGHCGSGNCNQGMYDEPCMSGCGSSHKLHRPINRYTQADTSTCDSCSQ